MYLCIRFSVYYLQQTKESTSGCSAVGSALRSGRRGRAFESPHPDQKRRQVSIFTCRLFFVFHAVLSVLCLRQSLNHAIFNIQPFGLRTLGQARHTHDAASDGHNHFGTGIDYKVANGNFEMGGHAVCLGVFGE